jgi:hypothetical protein
VNGCHPAGSEDFAFLLYLTRCTSILQNIFTVQTHTGNETRLHFTIGQATSHDASGLELQDLFIRQNYCSSGGGSMPHPTASQWNPGGVLSMLFHRRPQHLLQMRFRIHICEMPSSQAPPSSMATLCYDCWLISPLLSSYPHVASS